MASHLDFAMMSQFIQFIILLTFDALLTSVLYRLLVPMMKKMNTEQKEKKKEKKLKVWFVDFLTLTILATFVRISLSIV